MIGSNSLAHLRSVFRALQADSRGNVALLTAVAFPVMIGAVGAGVEYSRANNYGAQMQNAVDSAALAGATAVRNGMSASQAQTIAQNVFNANLNISGVSATAPQMQIQQMGAQYNVSISTQGSYNTALGQVLGINSATLHKSAQAQALAGPAGGGSFAGNSNGGGYVWGDPHVGFTNTNSGASTAVTFSCVGNDWYNMLSDGGFQWSGACINGGAFAGLIFGANVITAGTHTISYTSYSQVNPAYAGNASDSFSDDIVASATAANGVNSAAFPATLVVDGKTIDPTSTQYAGMTSFTVLNDPTQNVVVTVQMSNHATPTAFGTLPAGYYNYLAVDVKTTNYEISASYQTGYEWVGINAANAGMCGPVGGYYGSIIAGSTSADASPYVVSGPTFKGAQFGWTATCNNNGGQVAALIQ